MKDDEFAYAVAYIKTLDNKIAKTDFDSLAEVEAMRQNAFDEVQKLLGENVETNIFFYQNDFNNLKAVFSGNSWQELILSPFNVPPELLNKCAGQGDFEKFPDFIRPAAEKAYELASSDIGYGALEICIDNEWKRTVLEASSGYLHGYFELLVQLINYKTLWRCVLLEMSPDFCETASGYRAGSTDEVKKLILKAFPSADIGTIGEFELWCDGKLEEYADLAFNEYFSVRPILAFLIKTELRGRLICTKSE